MHARSSLALRSRLIAFFGPDGTGKSTHAKLLVDYLQSHKVKVKKAWIRSPHTVAYLLSYFFVKIGFCRTDSNPFGRRKKFPAVHTSKSLRLFWAIIEMLSVIPLIVYRVYIPLFLGYTVIAERYVVDTVVNVAYYTNDLRFLKSSTAKLLLRLIPKNTIFIYLDSDYSTLISRRGRNVESYDFFRFQRIGYEIIGNSLGVILINTSKNSIEQTSTKILHRLESSGQMLPKR